MVKGLSFAWISVSFCFKLCFFFFFFPRVTVALLCVYNHMPNATLLQHRATQIHYQAF